MLSRRLLLAALAVAPQAAAAASGSFDAFVAGLRAEAIRRGIRAATFDRAFRGVRPNPRVIELDRNQPESTFTWQQYRSRIVSPRRIADGRAQYARNRALMTQISARYGVPAGILIAIWGLESNYGQSTGGFNVIEALATLAWDGRRGAFFRSELLDALRILDHGDITPERMTGSWAGAMGQTQFMPDSFLKYATPWGGGTRRDIWDDLGSVFASTANYLAREGWQPGLPWGQPVTLPSGGLDVYDVGRDRRRPAGEWTRRGVRDRQGGPLIAPPGTSTAILLPGGAGDEAFAAYYPSYQAIRRYNPSDLYCISVGLIGDAVTG